MDIVAESMAEAAGVEAGDVLVEMNGVAVGNVEDLRTAAQTRQDAPGIPVTVERDGAAGELRSLPVLQPEPPGPSAGELQAIADELLRSLPT